MDFTITGHLPKEIASEMKAYCEDHGFIYLNIYGHVTNEKGFLKPEYTNDGVHLNEKALPIIKNLYVTALTRRFL